MFQQLRQQQTQQAISVDRSLVSSMFQPIATKRTRDTKSETGSGSDSDDANEPLNKRTKTQPAVQKPEQQSPEKQTTEEVKRPAEPTQKDKPVSTTELSVVPTIAEVPAKPTQTDAIAHFSKEVQIAITKAVSRLRGAETTYSVSHLGSMYELVVRNLAFPIRLSGIELMLGYLARETKLFIFDARVEFISGTLKLSFLPSRPLAGHLVRLPGVTLMQIDVGREGSPDPGDYEYVPHSYLKHKSKCKPLVFPSVDPPDLPGLDQNTVSMLTHMRDDLELMSGEFSPEGAEAVVEIIEGGFQVECYGHTQATLAELRRLVLPFPYHATDVIIHPSHARPVRGAARQVLGAVVAIQTRPYDKPVAPFFKSFVTHV